jgi:hypothetical protein|tara:strand:- start:580 stop:693 length:114 start_codon:yes stop_codon:yes gene_type:complete
MPTYKRAGNVMKVPPPAIELSVPPQNPARKKILVQKP